MSQQVVASSPARLFQLETLYEISRECAELDSSHDILHVLLSNVMGAFGAVRGWAIQPADSKPSTRGAFPTRRARIDHRICSRRSRAFSRLARNVKHAARGTCGSTRRAWKSGRPSRSMIPCAALSRWGRAWTD